MKEKRVCRYVLGIESSCDDFAIAVYDGQRQRSVMESCISQDELHAKFGGVVPEIASRGHLAHLAEVYDKLWLTTGLDISNIDLIAVTNQPGLIGSLLIGCNFAQSLAWATGALLLPIDHLQAHIYSVFIDQGLPRYPFISVLVSGGHSHLYLVKGHQQYELLGKTMDDACGEALDKAASLLGLSYPGGQQLEKLAAMDKGSYLSEPFSLPLKQSKDLSLSYSGLKTALRNRLIKKGFYDKQRPLLTLENWQKHYLIAQQQQLAAEAASFQEAAFKHLAVRIEQACLESGCNTVAICGGVSANKYWQRMLLKLANKYQWELLIPNKAYSTDNAMMVAYKAWLEYSYYQSSSSKPSNFIDANSRSPLSFRVS